MDLATGWRWHLVTRASTGDGTPEPPDWTLSQLDQPASEPDQGGPHGGGLAAPKYLASAYDKWGAPEKTSDQVRVIDYFVVTWVPTTIKVTGTRDALLDVLMLAGRQLANVEAWAKWHTKSRRATSLTRPH